MVSGFGRFIRADDVSKEMSDLRAYRCRIAVDKIREVPRNLSLPLGDEVFTVQVHLESWERVQVGGGDEPPVPPPDGHNNDHDNNLAGGLRDRASVVVVHDEAGEGGSVGEVDGLERLSEVSSGRGGGRTAVGMPVGRGKASVSGGAVGWGWRCRRTRWAMRRGSLGAPTLSRRALTPGCGGVTGARAWALIGPPPRPTQLWLRQGAEAREAASLVRGGWGRTEGKAALIPSDEAPLLHSPPPPRRTPFVGRVRRRGPGRLVVALAGEVPAAGGGGADPSQRVVRWSRVRRSREGLQLARAFSRGEDLD